MEEEQTKQDEIEESEDCGVYLIVTLEPTTQEVVSVEELS